MLVQVHKRGGGQAGVCSILTLRQSLTETGVRLACSQQVAFLLSSSSPGVSVVHWYSHLVHVFWGFELRCACLYSQCFYWSSHFPSPLKYECACMSVCLLHVWECLWRPEEGHSIRGAGITQLGSIILKHWEPSSGLLEVTRTKLWSSRSEWGALTHKPGNLSVPRTMVIGAGEDQLRRVTL